MDGLDIYGSEYLRVRFQSALLEKVAKLEKSIIPLAQQGLSRTQFAEKHALLVGRFMLGLQNFLAMSSEARHDFVPWTSRLSNKDFAILLWEFYQVPSDVDKIQILAQCLDDWDVRQPYLTTAATRTVTALARMLDPVRWGMLTWRNLACLGYESMTELKKARLYSSPASVQQEFAVLSIKEILSATADMQTFICTDLPTTASIAAALYCIGLDLWPIDAPFERQDPLANLASAECGSFGPMFLSSTP